MIIQNYNGMIDGYAKAIDIIDRSLKARIENGSEVYFFKIVDVACVIGFSVPEIRGLFSRDQTLLIEMPSDDYDITINKRSNSGHSVTWEARQLKKIKSS